MGYKKLMDAAGAVVSMLVMLFLLLLACYGIVWCIAGIAGMLA